MSETLLEARSVRRTFGGGRTLFGTRRPTVEAVRHLDLDLERGETLGLVGESGCGKSTFARMVVGLDRPSAGRIRLDGEDVSELARHDMRALARRIQYVFQDAQSALNPRKTIRRILEGPMIHLLHLGRDERAQRLESLMAAVNLEPDHLERYPHEFSGGQAQRIGIARALAAEPEIVILDEPVSSLDVSIQAQVLNLLADLKARFGLTYLFISHDLSVVETVSDRVAVMYFGRIVELAETRELFRRPRHPYSELLLRSVPIPGQKRPLRTTDNGEVAEPPDPLAPPPGCAFAPRCPRAESVCRRDDPELETKAVGGHCAACHFPLSYDGRESG